MGRKLTTRYWLARYQSGLTPIRMISKGAVRLLVGVGADDPNWRTLYVGFNYHCGAKEPSANA